VTTFDFSNIAYPSYMDLTASAGERYARWSGQGFPAHGFTPQTSCGTACVFCTHLADSYAHNVAVQAAAYAPTARQLSDALTRGTVSLSEYHHRRAGTTPGQVTATRIDADTVAIGGETYVRRPF
jgi:hypothetical protein